MFLKSSSLSQARRKFLAKAAHVTADLTGGTDGGLLAPNQASEFIRVATTPTALVSLSRQEFSEATKFEVPRVGFHNIRILKGVGGPVTEGARVPAGSQSVPATGLVTLSTNGYAGEVQVTRETLEDNIEREGYADTLMTLIGEAVGRDIEELALKSKTTHSDTTFNLFDGLIAQLDANVPSGQQYSATGVADVMTILRNLIELMPVRYRRNPKDLAIFVPQKVADAYVEELLARGTGLGDATLEDGRLRPYRGHDIIPVPLLSGSEAGLGNVDYTRFAFCTNPKNVITGWHRRVEVDKWYFPPERSWLFLPSVRFDIKVAEYDAVTFAEVIDSI